MTEPKTIDEALLMLQADPPVLIKNKSGQVGQQKTRYADLVQVNAQVLSRLNALGLVWKCRPDLEMPDYRFVLRYELRHVASGTSETGTYPLKGDTPMQQGSSITYARRYALLAVTGIAAEDEDDDGDSASGRPTAQRAAPRPRQQATTPMRGAIRDSLLKAADDLDPEELAAVSDEVLAVATGRPTAQRATQRPRGTRPPLPGENADGPVGTDQHRTMHALWRDIGYGGDEKRDERLTITGRIIGQPDLNSSATLTRTQADQVIAALRERKAKLDDPVLTGGGQ